MNAKLLARTAAVLDRIDQTLDDPYPAAVARLAGVPAGRWYCHTGDVVQVGSRSRSDLWSFTVVEDETSMYCHPSPPAAAPGADAGCWADHDWSGLRCGEDPIDDLGLCLEHYEQIVGIA